MVSAGKGVSWRMVRSGSPTIRSKYRISSKEGNVKRWTLMMAAGVVLASLLGGCIVVPAPGYYGGGGYYHHPHYDYYR